MATDERDARVGYIHPDGKRDWPETTVAGRRYERPSDTQDLSPNYFIVLDPFPPKNYPELLAEVTGTLPKTVQAAVKRQDKQAEAEKAGSDAAQP